MREAQTIVDRVLAKGEPVIMRDRYIPAQGNQFPGGIYVDSSVQPIRGADGAITGLFAVSIDVSEKVRARHRIEEQNTLLDIIIQNSPVGLALFDRDMRYVNVNEGYARMSRHTVEDLKGKVLYDISEAALSRKPIHDRAFAGEEIDDKNVPYRHPDGEIRYYDLLYRPVRDASGVVTGVLNAAIDVTERHQLDQQKDEFIALASHELKTPVTAIKGNAQIASRLVDEAENEKLARVLRTLNIQSDRLTRLINELLDISRVQDNTLAMRKERFDLPALALEVVAGMDMAAPDFTFNLVAPDRPCPVHADYSRIEQVMINLLQNAVKYTGNNKKHVEVNISRKGGEAVVAVRDYGVGIPAAEQSQVFDRFFRASNVPARKYGGLGLGLFISHSIIARHGGRMWLESTENQGSTFYFALPVTTQ